jgi:hypothetical protein
VETGLDRLWLSGLLDRPDVASIEIAEAKQMLRWIHGGTQGNHLAAQTNGQRDSTSNPAIDRPRGAIPAVRWRWETYYPTWQATTLGRLRQVIRFRVVPAETSMPHRLPFGPGTSGAAITAGGIPIGMQIAAEAPHFEVGYAQSFEASLGWLRRRLRCTRLSIVQLI